MGKDSPYPGTDWVASGVYINDNGMDVDQNGTYNSYSFLVSKKSEGNLETIRILVTTNVQATKYRSKDNQNCTAVNKNDYI